MSLAAYVPKPPNPGPFATLFKHSKFSSFDPEISQVYTTYGGDAHRGNWGFKRPLSMRRRGAYITVKDVDTREQQTAWNSAEPQAFWIKRMEELHLSFQKDAADPWGSRKSPELHSQWLIQSDYLPRPLVRPKMIPNVYAMDHDEFQRYLRKLRDSRTEFRNQIQEDASFQALQGLSLYQLAQLRPPSSWHEMFAKHESEKRRTDPLSTDIEPVTHRFGALLYTQYSLLQSYLVTRPQPGRNLEHIGSDGAGRRQAAFIAGFAGMTPTIRRGDQETTTPMTWGTLHETGVTQFRVQSVTLKRAPRVVGHGAGGLKGTRMEMEVKSVSRSQHNRTNMHRPGSREYIAAQASQPSWHKKPPPTMMNSAKIAAKHAKQYAQSNNQQTLDALQNIVSSKNAARS